MPIGGKQAQTVEPERSGATAEGRRFLVEHYRPGITVEGFRETTERLRQMAKELTSSTSPIGILHTTLVLEDESAFCLFHAPSRAIVEEAYHRAGVPFERIVDALELPQSVRD